MNKVVLLSCVLGLGACASIPPPQASVPTRADRAVARASAELARYCGLTQAALSAIGLFAKPKTRAAADYASVVVETVCASPPTDISTALATVGRAYAAVSAAKE